MTDIVSTVVVVAGSSVGSAFGAWLALHNRVTAIEHELWGAKGDNGLKGAVRDIQDTVRRFMLIERRAIQRIDKRNAEQHPSVDD